MAGYNEWFGGGSKMKDYKTYMPETKVLPGFEESDWARGEVKNRLEAWGGQPGYGAIAPNWDDMWGMAQKRVKQHFWGDEAGPGVMGKITAEAEKRGQTDQPAFFKSLNRMGKTEAGEMSDLAIKQAIQEAQFSETGRNTWLKEMNFLTQQRPTYQVGMTIAPGSGGQNDWWGALGDLGSAAVSKDWSGGGETEDYDEGADPWSGGLNQGYWDNLGQGDRNGYGEAEVYGDDMWGDSFEKQYSGGEDDFWFGNSGGSDFGSSGSGLSF